MPLLLLYLAVSIIRFNLIIFLLVYLLLCLFICHLQRESNTQSINIRYKKFLHIIILSQQLKYKCDNLMTFPMRQHKFIANVINNLSSMLIKSFNVKIPSQICPIT